MYKPHVVITVIAVTFFVFLGLSVIINRSFAQFDGDYVLVRHSIDGGGYTFSLGDRYVLGGTIGQPDAGALQGGGYFLGGGFWGSAVSQWVETRYIFLPVVIK